MVCNCTIIMFFFGANLRGYGQMNNTFSPCYVCNDIAQPSKIFPKMRPSGERRRHTHSCYASNCFNRAGMITFYKTS